MVDGSSGTDRQKLIFTFVHFRSAEEGGERKGE